MSPVKKGSLIVVGTGYRLAGQITLEAVAGIQKSDKIFHICHPLTEAWIKTINPSASSLMDCYAAGKDREDSYEEMVERILGAVREGFSVCAAFYGHPAKCVDPSREAIRRARSEGYRARMLPGISAEDVLMADLNIDTARRSQSFEATEFLVCKRNLDISASLVLWQIGNIGVGTHVQTNEVWNRGGIKLLQEVLVKIYSSKHKVIVYEASPYPVCDSHIEEVPLGRLTKAHITTSSTLYVPPKRQAPPDKRMVARVKKSLEENLV